MFNDYIEDAYKPAYEAWKNNQTPESNLEFLNSISPIVQKGIQMYGGDSPLAASRGRLLALEAAKTYDPKRARLQSHILNQMQGLKRISQKQSQIISAPERVLLDRQKLQQQNQELLDELGREPTDAELSDKLGISMQRLAKVRSYQPGITSGQLEENNPLGVVGGKLPGQQKAENLWAEIVYQDLNPLDQRIMELSLGMRGNKKLSNAELAAKLGRSPGAITQRKLRIQKLLDQEQQLSPFIAE